MKGNLVSVIITTFNRENYATKAIKSALGQDYENIEFIVVDDCSTDNTSKIVLEYCNKDKRIKLITNKTNLGVAKSLNKGIDSAKGKYIAILDSDDIWSDSEKLKKQVAFLESHADYSLAGGGAVLIDQSGKEIFRYLLPENDQDIRKKILIDNCFVHSAVVFAKEDWKRVGGYKEYLKVDWDWGLCLELGRIGKFYNFQEYFVDYLQWPENISNLDASKNFKTRIILINKHKKYYPGYFKSFILAWFAYSYSFLPFKKKLRPLLILIRKIFFGPSPYEKS